MVLRFFVGVFLLEVVVAGGLGLAYWVTGWATQQDLSLQVLMQQRELTECQQTLSKRITSPRKR